jgi:hypothetical protein
MWLNRISQAELRIFGRTINLTTSPIHRRTVSTGAAC